MRRLECWWRLGMVALLWAAAGAMASAAEPELLRHRAPVIVEQQAALMRLLLTPAVYARSHRGDLADMRLLDARGERVPFALLAPRADALENTLTWRDAALYRLPPRPAAGGPWTAPVEVSVDGQRISVRQRGKGTAPELSPGWLIDLGERAKDQPSAQTLQLQWPQAAEFTAPYTIEHSADLRLWRAASGGQLLALNASGGSLTQPDITLPAGCERFVRLVWSGSAAPPHITGARAATPASVSKALDVPTDINVAASPEPAGPHAGTPAGAQAPKSLHFDLGAPMPLRRLELHLPAGNWVLPLRVQSRERSNAPWEPLAGTVFYRLERGSELARSPALEVQRTARYIRLVPDERASLPPADALRLTARVQLASLVFAAQGQPPYVLMAGAAKASSGALPIATLVPDLERERERLGRATVGAWSEVPEAAAQAQTQERLAALRPWMLWALLLFGVAALGWMVWRLLRADRV